MRVAHRLDWTLLEMHERLVDDEWVARKPNYARHLGKPISQLMVWRTS